MLPSLPARVLYAAAALCGGICARADVPALLPIDRVTVYPQGAMVTRTGVVRIPAGAERLVFPGLPEAIDTKTLHVSVENPGVRLGAIDVEQVNEGHFTSEAERGLRRRIEQTGDVRAGVQDQIATAQLQLKLLESLAADPQAGADKARLDGASLNAVLASVGLQSAAARKRLRDAAVQLRGVDRELDQWKADLAKIETRSQTSTVVRTAVDAAAAVAVRVTVSYTIPDAGWHWIYEARLDTNQRRVTLERQGQVQQGSGEDWRNVELTLTTARPAGDVATPVVAPLFVHLEEWQPRLAWSAQRQASDLAMPAAAPALLAADLATRAKRATASVIATDYLANYRVPDRVTLLADRDPRLYPIGADVFDVELVARVMPSMDRVAHLEAAFRYQREVPLEGGELQLYRDGAYVGDASTAALLPGADVRLPFGADERIQVQVREEPAQSGERGLLNRQLVKETHRRFDITSFHASKIAIEVMDPVPVSQSADVLVEMLKDATPPTTRDVDGKAGVLAWRFDASPQKTLSIQQDYAIHYPRDRQITLSSGGAGG